MPRNPHNPREFIAGPLPVVTFHTKQYFVDGRTKQVRSIDDVNDTLDVCYDDSIWDGLTSEAKKVIQFEFNGIKS